MCDIPESGFCSIDSNSSSDVFYDRSRFLLDVTVHCLDTILMLIDPMIEFLILTEGV